MVNMRNTVYFLEADENSQRPNDALLTSVRNIAHEKKQKVIILTNRCQPLKENAKSISIRQLFLHLYRDHKLGGNKTETFLSRDEQLVVVQLSIASWNKMKNGTFEADVRSVLKVSNEILRTKLREISVPGEADFQSIQTNYSISDLSKTPKRVKSLQTQSPSGLRHSCLRTPESRKTPRSQTLELSAVRSPRTPAGVTAKCHLGYFSKTPEQTLDGKTISELLEHYNAFVQKCHKIDIVDIFLKVKDFFSRNDSEETLFAQENLIVIEHLPRDYIETELLKFLAGDVPVNCLSLSPDVSTNFLWEHCHLGGQDVHITKLPISSLWKSNQLPICPPVFNLNLAEETSSVSERFIRKLLLSYISLLVNSADELALARCLCLPDRGLSHDGFTALKHLAAKKKMSMFLTAFSFVFEMRREKATSESYSPLFPYSKPLGEFVDLADKLMTITQDIPSVDLAVGKVLKTLKINLSKSRTCALRPASVEKVCSELLTEIQNLLHEDMLDLKVTPKPVGCGGSMRGQQVIKLFRSVLDIESTKVGQYKVAEDLCDQQSSQNTPLRLPSLLSQFSSPQVVEKPLDTKSSKDQNGNKTTATISYTKSHYGWVATDISMKENYLPDVYYRETATTFEMCKSKVIHARPAEHESSEKHHTHEKPTESLHEVNVSSTTGSEEGKTAPGENQSLTTPTVGGKVKKIKGPSLKRKKLLLEQNEKQKKARKVDSRKKTIPVSKGQKLLTNFFRMSKAAVDKSSPDA